MSDFDFVIPLKKEDLQVSTEDQYSVNEVIPLDDVVDRLEECATALANVGSTYILTNFDTVYSGLIHFNELNWTDVHRMFDKVICKGITVLYKYLEETLEDLMSDGANADVELRTQALNILKMTVYLFSQFFQCYNIKMSQKQENVVTGKMKGRKKKNKNDEHAEEYSWDWEEKQKTSLFRLCALLQLPLVNLWAPPVVEETFTNTAAECCYIALENPSMNLVKGKPLKDIIVQVLGILIKQYNHGLSFIVKGVQLMKRFEHVASPLAEAVTKFVNQLGCKSLIKRLLEEIIEASADLQVSSDQHVAKSFSAFLTEIAEANPSDIEPVLDSVYPFLDSELFSLRILGLSVITEVLLGCLSSDQLESEANAKRETCLELLEEHILDINAFVRAKDLQFWEKIVSHGALPKNWVIPLMEIAIEAMTDVSTTATKQAIHLLKVMMETNPFASKLILEEVQTALDEETTLYMELKKKEKENMLPKEGGEEHIWNKVEPELRALLEEYFKDGGPANETDSGQPSTPDKILGNHLNDINKFITERTSAKAFKLLEHAEESLSGFKDLRKGIEVSNVDFYLHFFKKTFLEQQIALPIEKTGGTPVKQPPSTPAKRILNKTGTVGDENQSENNLAPSLLDAQEARVIFYTDCVKFVKKLNQAVEKAMKLLSSKQVFEVVEAVEFIKLAKQFGVSGSEAGVIEMMRLIHCPEESIRTAATKALEVLYLQPEGKYNSPTAIANHVVKSLCSLVKNTKLSQKEVLETLIKEWVKTSALNAYCIVAMISVLSMEEKGTTPDESLLALVLFSCVVRAQPHLVNDNLDTLVQKGLTRGRRKSKIKDLAFVHHVCEILQFAKSSHPSKRFPNNHKIFIELLKAIKENFLDFTENNYLYMVEEALNVIFKLALDPESLALCVLRIAFFRTFGKSNQEKSSFLDNVSTSSVHEKSVAGDEDDAGSVALSVGNVSVDNSVANVSGVSLLGEKQTTRKTQFQEEAVARFVFILGHIALKLCIYLEQDVLEEKKKRMKDKQDKKKPAVAEKKQQLDEDDELSMAVDMSAANDDALAEEIRNICENEVLYGDGMIATFVNCPVKFLQNDGNYSLRMKSVASVAMGKFMLVSSKYCSQNIQLFVTILEKTSDVVVKNNLIVLFGELMVRFPNVIEPWISYLYLRLRDTSRKVRLNALLVISHLITHEMVKVKAQISDVARCIVDEEEDIKDAACSLFEELSTKSNVLYNVLLDIISTLSNPLSEMPLTADNFRKILRFLIDLVQKEKQMELLVEKLCLRLRESTSERQWSDLAFCLSLFSYSDRSLRKLIDSVTCFGDKLHCPAVYECLIGIISSANKSTKPGVKETAAELNALVEQALDKGIDDLDATPNVRNAPRIRPTTKRAARGGRSVRKKPTISDSDTDSDNDKKARTAARRTVKKTIKFSSDSESEQEQVKGRTKERTVKKALKYTDSSSESEEDEVFQPQDRTARSVRKRHM